MKKSNTTVMTLLTGLFMIIFAVSCSKDEGGGSGPSISRINPTSGVTGATITIEGRNLSESTVTIGGISAPVSDNTSTSITTMIPHTTVGTHELVITNPLGTVKANINVTGIGAPPEIISISPEEVAIGESITITGTGFGGGVSVEIATKLATVTDFTGTTVTAVVPSGIATGSASVRVTTFTGSVVSSVIIK